MQWIRPRARKAPEDAFGLQLDPADEQAAGSAPAKASKRSEGSRGKGSARLQSLGAGLRTRKDAAAEQTGPWPYKEVATKKTLLVAAAVALACGPLALMRGHASATATVPVASSSAPTLQVAQQRQAEWVATQFFTQWSTTTTANQAALLGQVTNPPVSPMFPTTPAAAPTSVQVVSSTSPRPGLWQITLHALGGSFGSGAWYMVPVDATDTSVAIDSLPSPVAALNTAPDQVTGSQVDPASAPGQTATGLVTALLTGGNTATLQRWTVPNYTPAALGQLCSKTTITDITASPQDQNTLANATLATVPTSPADPNSSSSPTAATTPASGPGVHALVTVTATCTQPQTTRLVSYRVGLTNAGGQWAVDQVN